MSKLDEYMSLSYKIETISDLAEDGYAAYLPELVGCITCGDTIEAALKNVENAKKEWILAALEDNYPIPEPLAEKQVLG